jgi:SAM-dependent methyltransferase
MTFYSGLVADLYGALRSQNPDPEPYARFIGRSGEPALELGCGDGDPLLDLLERGLDVEGLDVSQDMLTRARRRAAARGLTPVLHLAAMESMDLPRRFRSIFLAGATFCLLEDDEAALAALRRIAEHLEPDGSALIPLFVPPPPDLGRTKEAQSDDGALLRATPVRCKRDERTRVQITVLRYERHSRGHSEVVERAWRLHWFDRHDFVHLAANAGLCVRHTAEVDQDSWSVIVAPAGTR